MGKAKKQRAENYEEKVSIDGTFEDVIGVSVNQSNMTKNDKLKAIYEEVSDAVGKNSADKVQIDIHSYANTNGNPAGQGGFTTIQYKFKDGVTVDEKNSIKNALISARHKLGFGSISEV